MLVYAYYLICRNNNYSKNWPSETSKPILQKRSRDLVRCHYYSRYYETCFQNCSIVFKIFRNITIQKLLCIEYAAYVHTILYTAGVYCIGVLYGRNTRAKMNILNDSERITFTTSEYSNILSVLSIKLLA